MSNAPRNGAKSADGAELRLYREVIAELEQEGRTGRRKEIEAALSRTKNPPAAIYLANLLTHCCFAEQDYAGAMEAWRKWLDRAPDDRGARDTLLSILSRLQRFAISLLCSIFSFNAVIC